MGEIRNGFPKQEKERSLAFPVPMVMYHSVADADADWPFSHLSCPVAVFESHLKALRRANFQTITLKMLYEHMSEGNEIPSKSVVLTFDDGYLDNWVYAYPLMKKYGYSGVIFVNPDFVDPSSKPRPNLEDVWNKKASVKDLPKNGFLSWSEMKVMEHSGVIDIQSHTMTHTWYFSSDEIIDFHNPDDTFWWLAWNANPERKYLWMSEDQHTLVPWGTPIYKHEKSLATRRYFPDEGLSKSVVTFVMNEGNEAFFANINWRGKLLSFVQQYQNEHDLSGYYESDQAYEDRIREELAKAKSVIEQNLDKTVEFLCWPGGGYDEFSMEISKSVGYIASTLSSRDIGGRKNRVGEDPTRWSRTSPPKAHVGRNRKRYLGGIYFVLLLNSIRNGVGSIILYKLLKAPYKVAQWIHTLIDSQSTFMRTERRKA